jgi:hypothetical protein
MVLNPWTGHVLPQYHVVFDDLFTTVPLMENCKVPLNLVDLVEKSCDKVTDEHNELAKTWLFSSPEPEDISMPDCTNNNMDLGISMNYNFSQITLHTGIEPPLSSVGLFSSLNANKTSQNNDYLPGISHNDDYVPSLFCLFISKTCLLNLKILCWSLFS